MKMHQIIWIIIANKNDEEMKQRKNNSLKIENRKIDKKKLSPKELVTNMNTTIEVIKENERKMKVMPIQSSNLLS